jgi:hypothetical protein
MPAFCEHPVTSAHFIADHAQMVFLNHPVFHRSAGGRTLPGG